MKKKNTLQKYEEKLNNRKHFFIKSPGSHEVTGALYIILV